MTGWQFFLAGWDWEPSVIVGCALLLVGYLAMVGFRLTWRTFSFASGTLVLFLALVSPLDTLADSYLFSAHMLQHILLILIVPPLWIMGIPAHMLKKSAPASCIRKNRTSPQSLPYWLGLLASPPCGSGTGLRFITLLWRTNPCISLSICCSSSPR